MRISVVLFTVSAMSLGVGNALAQPSLTKKPPGDVGRFALFQGEYTFVNIKGEQFKQRALFKLDTVTGELFICEGWQYDGKHSGKPGQLIQKHECKPFEVEVMVPLQK